MAADSNDSVDRTSPQTNWRRDVQNLKQTDQELIDALTAENNLYKREHAQFREAVQSPGAGLLMAQQQSTNDPNGVCLKHKQICDEAINNLNHQLQHLNKERDSCHMLWKNSEKTIANLQMELAEYKRLFNKPDAVGQLQRDHKSVCAAYKSTIETLQRQLINAKTENAQLAENKLQMKQSLASIESTYKNFLAEHAESAKRVVATESSLNSAKSHISEMLRHRGDLERKLSKSNAALAEQIDRETKALAKIQEVLGLAEAATAERNAAIEREKETKEECEHLATTIGQIMEEAANKCEQDMERRQNRFKDTINTLEKHIEQLSHLLESQTTKTKESDARLAAAELTIEKQTHHISMLDVELEQASRAVIEMEIKIKELEELLDREKEVNRLNDDRCATLTGFLSKHRQLKQSWKSTVDDITDKYQEMAEENATLKTELSRMHVKMLQLPKDDFMYGDGHNNVIYMTSRKS